MIKKRHRLPILFSLLAIAVLAGLGKYIYELSKIDPEKVIRVSVQGYDIVSFFQPSGPQKGDYRITHHWNKTDWHFVNEANRDSFKVNPAKYNPQFGGNCAFSTSIGKEQEGFHKYYEIRDGLLYFNSNPVSHFLWKQFPSRLEKARYEWNEMLRKKGEKVK